MSASLASTTTSVAPTAVPPTTVRPTGIPEADSPTRTKAHRRGREWFAFGFLPRVAALMFLTFLANSVVFISVANLIADGSRSAYLVVMPVLLVMIAYGRRTEPTGNSDGEADWILGLSLCGFALAVSYLATYRFPTLSGMWNLPLIDAVIWTAFGAIILFGFRRVWQLWPLWVFAIVTVTPFPSLLLTAALGGTTAAASSVAAIVGAVAVFLAGWPRPMRWRLVAAAGCALAGVSAAAALATTPLMISVIVTAGVIPLLSFLLLQRFTTPDSRQVLRRDVPAGSEGSGRNSPDESRAESDRWPRRSPVALVVLSAVAGLHLIVINQATAVIPSIPAPFQVEVDWIAETGFTPGEDFGFIQRFLGPDSTFTRYLPPPESGYPTAVVDVITAPDLADLRATRNVVWYPAGAVPNYRFTDLGSALPGALVLATDSSAAAIANTDDWYAVTWTWAVGDVYQQIFVVVSQQPPPQDSLPPRPVAPSLMSTMVAPALWMSRQQADPDTMVDAIVSDRARHVVNTILLAANTQPRVGPQ